MFFLSASQESFKLSPGISNIAPDLEFREMSAMPTQGFGSEVV